MMVFLLLPCVALLITASGDAADAQLSGCSSGVWIGDDQPNYRDDGSDGIYKDNTWEGKGGGDELWSRKCFDFVRGNEGGDSIHGGDGVDDLTGDDNNDDLYGGDNTDALCCDQLGGGNGGDYLSDDTIETTSDQGDVAHGGPDADTVVVSDYDIVDHADGGQGNDDVCWVDRRTNDHSVRDSHNDCETIYFTEF